MNLAPLASQGPEDRAEAAGLCHLLTVIENLRASDADGSQISLLVDNGDLLHGTAMADFLAARGDRGHLHPVAEALNTAGYDVVGLGNHDLDFGLDYLGWFARGVAAPVVASNLAVTPSPDWLAPHALLSRGELSIGVVSVMPESAPDWVLGILEQPVRAEEMRSAIARTAATLRDAGADVVLALAHSGLGGAASENQIDMIARDGHVDAIVGGHNHERFPSEELADLPGVDTATGTVFGIPVVMPGRGGEALGVITLDLVGTPGTGWTVQSVQARLEAPASEPRSTHVKTVARPLSQLAGAAEDWLAAPVGHTAIPLTSYFARVQPTRLLALTAAAMQHAIAAERVGTSYADLPLIGIAAPVRAGGQYGPAGFTDISAGAVSRRDLLDMAHFDDKIWAVVLTGAELREWLERVASQFLQMTDSGPGRGLLDTRVPAPDCDSFWGITYAIDPTRPARYNAFGDLIDETAGRITRLTHNGRDIAKTDRFLAALTSYRAAGGGRFPGMGQDRPVLRAPLSKTEALAAMLAQPDPKLPRAPWRFDTGAPHPGSHWDTWIETGPGATAHLWDISALQSGPPVSMPSGYLRIPVRL